MTHIMRNVIFGHHIAHLSNEVELIDAFSGKGLEPIIVDVILDATIKTLTLYVTRPEVA